MNRAYTRTKRRKERGELVFTEERRPGPNHDVAAVMHQLQVAHFTKVFGERQRAEDYSEDYATDDEDEGPLIDEELDHLLRSITQPIQEHYVYDVYSYGIRWKKNADLKRLTENTLRISVISPVMFGKRQQCDPIIHWGVQKDIIPANWKRQQVIHENITEKAKTFVEIADTFVQCLLRTEPENLIKISYHIGEWYHFSNSKINHHMRRNYSLEALKNDLNQMMLLPSVICIYADDHPQLIWYIAVFVCHQYFFYLADSEYKEHNLINSIACSNKEPARKLREEGNDYHKLRKYTDAITKYSEALDHSPYNHMVYANRAMSYLKLSETEADRSDDPTRALKYAYHAMSDAFKCIKIDPLYAKGHDRYAMALVALKSPKEAVSALKAAIQNMAKYPKLVKQEDIKTLEKRIAQYSPDEKLKKTKAIKDGIEKGDGDGARGDKEAGASGDKETGDVASESEEGRVRSKLVHNSGNDNNQTMENAAAAAAVPSESAFIDTAAVNNKQPKTASGEKENLIYPSTPTTSKKNIKSDTGKNSQKQHNTRRGATKREPKKVANEAANGVSGEEGVLGASPDEEAVSALKAAIQNMAKYPELVKQEDIEHLETRITQYSPDEKKSVVVVDPAVLKAIEDVHFNMRFGSEALLTEKYRFAITLYEKSFRIIQQFTSKTLGQSAEEVIVLRYARGVAYISDGLNEDIILGMQELRLILESQPSQTMKAITLYELGIAYTKQHRYGEALEPASESMKICQSKNGPRNAYYWPGTDVFIQHTDASVLKVTISLDQSQDGARKLSDYREARLTVLLEQCNNPPPPDYKCAAELKTCTAYGHPGYAIYIDGLDFKGYASLYCSEKCHLHYHRDCWKKKHIKIGVACITPDCSGFISKYIEYDEQNQKYREEKSEKQSMKILKTKKPALKIPPSSVIRIEQIRERKLRRKEIRAEKKRKAVTPDTEVADSLADKILSNRENREAADASLEPDTRTSPFVIKHKKREEEMEQQQVSRKPTKKVKNKGVMSLDEFCGPSIYDDNESNYSSGSLGLGSDQLFKDLARFERSYQPESLPVVIQGISVDELKQTVSEMYYDLLEANGPMTVDSKKISEYLEDETAAKELILYSGGLATFLLATGRFMMIENLICVREDEQKAIEMVEAVRSVSHGVGVVPHDFKANLERASAYVPERKKFSGYEDSSAGTYKSKWRSIVNVDDWRIEDDASIDDRSRSLSSDAVDLEIDGIDSQVEEKPPILVERISPTLLEAWKRSQDQAQMDRLEALEDKVIDERSARQTELFFSTTNSEDSGGRYAQQTTSVDSLPPDNSEVEVRCSSNESCDALSGSGSTHSRIVTPPNFSGYMDRTKDSSITAIPDEFRHMFIDPQPYIPQQKYGMPQPRGHPVLPPQAHLIGGQIASINSHMAPTGTQMAPIGTQMATIGPHMAPIGTQMAPIGTSRPFSSHPTMYAGNSGHLSNGYTDNLWSVGYPEWESESPSTTYSVAESTSTQTEDLRVSTDDKQCATEYEYMDDYEKKFEECEMLHRRNEELSDMFTKLRTSSSVEIQDLRGQLGDARLAEKETRLKSDKIQQTCEKEIKRWKEEKRSLTEEVNAVKQTCNETRWKMEEKESKLRELEETLGKERCSHEEEVMESESQIRQYIARLEAMEKKAMNAELEVIDQREKFSLMKCNEALEITNKSIDQLRAQVERFVQNNRQVPEPLRTNTGLAAARRQKLMDIRDEQMAVYESQREAVRSGIPFSSLPKLSPPSLMEIMASTSLPRPPPMPMMNMGLPRHRAMLSHMQPLQPQFHPAGPMGGGRLIPQTSPPHLPVEYHQAPHQTAVVTGRTSPTPGKDQSQRRNAEQQLIQDIQNVFPNLSGEAIRGYIHKLRQSRQGQGLTGLKLLDLRQQIIELILQDSGGSPADISNPSWPSSREECAICHEQLMQAATKTLTCHHTFHRACIGDWLNRQNTCPVCRAQQL